MTIGSLFAGIGGLELGLEWAGFGPTLWQVEQDKFCREILARHWPEAKRYDDVRMVRAGEVEPIDLLCGGFPCQDVSTAGNGAGLEGERSGLWFEFLRLIRELRPRYVVVENVSALLFRGLGVVLGGLAESGYDARWDCIPASAVGAPHQRDRLFVVAVADAASSGSQIIAEWPEQPLSLHRPNESTLAHSIPGLTRDSQRWPPGPVDMLAWERMPPGFEPLVCRMADGVRARLDSRRIKALGNAVVPAVAERVGMMLHEFAAEVSA